MIDPLEICNSNSILSLRSQSEKPILFFCSNLRCHAFDGGILRVKTFGFIKTRAELYKAFGFSSQVVCEVWADRWAEREGKGRV